MAIATPPVVVTLLICDDPNESCWLGNCYEPADLVIVSSDEKGDVPERHLCIRHWGALRVLFVGPGSEIRRGVGVSELIAERLSTWIGEQPPGLL